MQTLTEETIVHAHYLHWSIWECSICRTVCSVVTSCGDQVRHISPHKGHIMEEGSGDNIVVSTIVSSLVKVCNGNNYQCQLNAEPDQ